jgi:thioredoxin 1
LYGDNKIVQNNHDEALNDILAKKSQQLSHADDVSNESSSGEKGKMTLAAPLILNDSNFAQAVEKYPLLVVDFWAPWCGPCRILGPTIEQLARDFAGKVIFGKLNVDENPQVAGAFGIQSIPSVAIFKNGQIVDGFVGVASKSQIQSKISQYVDGAARSGNKSYYNNIYY